MEAIVKLTTRAGVAAIGIGIFSECIYDGEFIKDFIFDAGISYFHT